MSAYTELVAYQRETEALGQVMGRLGWDQETVMPRGAGEQRAEEMAALEGVLHARRVDPRMGDWLDKIEDADLDPVGQATMRIVRKDYARNTKVPGELASEIARTVSKAQGVWAEARANEDVSAFLPVLKTVIDLRQQEGAAISDGGDTYDALLQDYEPGGSATELSSMFDAMRPRLVALRDEIWQRPEPKGVTGSFDVDAQMALSDKLSNAFGYDREMGRIDKAVHPFSSGSGQDVRITTRTSDDDPFNCIYSTIHEVGHATYEQSINNDYLLTPLGAGVSMGVHESQSRIYENQLGRSRAFTGWLFGEMKDSFGDFGISTEDDFYAAVNRVGKGYIRTESDEVQYNLHILLRFDLERALMSGDLQVNDLEAAWNDRFKSDFGYAVDKPSNGCLQDVHWSVGLFGYFPTYSLGNVYAGCLYEALRDAVPQLDDQLAQGNTQPALAWLRDSLQTHGGLRAPKDTIAHACGFEPSAEPLLKYTEKKFSNIYGL
ncbi:MAG: carboxypeptidase M32 [Paracoccaceae bacterium]|nr:carboxypeptidase M32 [Paracoccaceae bacterium]MDG2259692.1 carboxypeptidase M32 [Paracoccaceae bacterium]